ncbi:GNAT family N-acetyltransferase [Kosmotoga pacifica]|uniref:Acetyltransferase n=1 Tax=Kosmotoga pacifica TaxID=1330330 RepID=A0A0G2ZGA2_9BACT|nr:GNAT family protein [Kosmotoga pacifica]AKI97833.1 acetyltransferase [Kosmotoga pacifica]
MLEGSLVRLRAYSREDIEQAWKYFNDFEVKKYLNPGIPFPIKLEEEYSWYENLSSSKDTYSFAIERKEDKRYIGGCGVNSVDWKNSNAKVGIFLGRPYWSKGYGTDAMKVLLRFIFTEMNLHKVLLNVYSFNERAMKSYKKCGFVEEGRLREQIFRMGRYYDTIIMGLLKKDFTENMINKEFGA